MDKQTLSNYGWLVILTLVLAVMLAFATPFGNYVKIATQNTLSAYIETNNKVLDEDYQLSMSDKWDEKLDKNKNYKLLKGNNETFIITDELLFVSDAPLRKFKEVKIDGNIVDLEGYTSSGDTTNILLFPEFSETLTIGQHKIEIISNDGKASGEFYLTYKYDTNDKKLHHINIDFGSGRTEPQAGDTYLFGDYIYTYIDETYGSGWDVKINTKVTDKNRETYGYILESINGKPIISLVSTFEGCESLITAPKIPTNTRDMLRTFYGCVKLVNVQEFSEHSAVSNMGRTFEGCISLTQVPKMPRNVYAAHACFANCTSLETTPDFSNIKYLRIMNQTFWNCTNLKNILPIPNTVYSLHQTFRGCTSLEVAPTIPNSVTDIHGTFWDCHSLKTYVGSTAADGDFSDYKLPDNVNDMYATFDRCKKMTHSPKIPNTVTIMDYTFLECDALVHVQNISTSTETMRDTFRECTSLISAPIIPDSVLSMVNTFYGCTSLQSVPNISNNAIDIGFAFTYCSSLKAAPKIPASVKTMDCAFYNCTSMVGNITIDAEPESYAYAFSSIDMHNITISGSCDKKLKQDLASTGLYADFVTIID